MSMITSMASLADRALLIWPIKGMAIRLGGALSFLLGGLLLSELMEESGIQGTDEDEKGEARLKVAMTS